MKRMGLVARSSLYSVCTDGRTTFLTSPHPQRSGNMLFALVHSSHLASFSRELTGISIGGAILHSMGRTGLVAGRSLYAV